MLNVEIAVNEKSVRLPYDQIDNLLYAIPEEPEYNGIVAELIKSPDPRVRMTAASRASLNRKIVETLVEDNQVDVLRSLVFNRKARRYIPENCLLRLLRTGDYEIQKTVAEHLEDFWLCDKEVLVEKLVRSEDPVIRGILAKDDTVERQILELLSADDDEDIASLAENTLEILEEDEIGDDEDEEDEEEEEHGEDR